MGCGGSTSPADTNHYPTFAFVSARICSVALVMLTSPRTRPRSGQRSQSPSGSGHRPLSVETSSRRSYWGDACDSGWQTGSCRWTLSDRSEDALTDAVFGAIRHPPYRRVLGAVLAAADAPVDLDTFGEARVELWPSYQLPQLPGMRVEPDVVATAGTAVVVFEVKSPPPSRSTPPSSRPAASRCTSSLRCVAGAVGTAVLSTVLAGLLAGKFDVPTDQRQLAATTAIRSPRTHDVATVLAADAFASTFVWVLVLTVICVVPALFLPNRGAGTRGGPPASEKPNVMAGPGSLAAPVAAAAAVDQAPHVDPAAPGHLASEPALPLAILRATASLAPPRWPSTTSAPTTCGD